LKTKGIYFLYRVLQALVFPAVLAYFLFRSLRHHAYLTSLPQRLGFLSRRSFKQTVPGAIWLHAVSVGEVVSVIELARRLRKEFPRAPLFISTATVAGRAAAREKLADIVTGIFYAPIDHVFAVRRVLRTLRPALVVILETEIWPNLFREAKRAGSSLVILNGRISDRTERRYRRHRWFFREVMRWPDAVLVQSEAMRERYLSIGSPPGRVQVGGNLKYDFAPSPADAQSPARRFLKNLHAAEVWIAASTMPPASAGDVDEDDAVIAAFHELAPRHARLLLLLAPRKPERFDAVAAKLSAAGIRFVRRRDLERPLQLPGTLLLDSIGELSGLFALADVVFMGGTLAARGGHNILEPAFFARPIVCGPHMENFPEISRAFRAHGAFVEIESASQLARAVDQVLSDPGRATELGRRAVECAESEHGATERAMAAIRAVIADSSPRFRPNLVSFLILWPISRLWTAAAAWKRARDTRHRRRLAAGVISVGNITMGGTGKTPLVLYVAEQMRLAGRQPGILSRGYGRHSLDRHLILEPGAHVKVTQSGDEPQIFLRSGVAPVGIGADRFQTGRLLEERFGADVLILDDGFQHVRLERQVDIVLIDALTPFGGREVFPLGRLREPLEALARADAIVITRSESQRGTHNIQLAVRRYNVRAPVFHARTVAECWVDAASGQQIPALEPPFSQVGAFCGLGNPESFWGTLELLKLRAVNRVAFGDHHAYRGREMRQLALQFAAAKAEAAVTTEKDAINLCEGCSGLMAPLPVYWLKIRTAIEREEEFLKFIERRLGARRKSAPARHAGQSSQENVDP
jgi:3-deoxy-D-manno-octulosonic-acid transferase